ncbi:MAG: hypothetical protein ACREPM_00115, partial [Gemmatimonadaceae bacterium]
QQATLDFTWRPIRDGTSGVTAIAVTEVLSAAANPHAFSIRAPITYAGVRGIADRVEQLVVRDSLGDVPLERSDEPAHPGGFPNYRHWRARRAVAGGVTISFRSLVQPPPGGGPPFGIRAAAGGVSGAGSGFLVLPEDQPSVRSRVHWDLSDLAAGSTAVTTFGEGDFTLAGKPDDVTDGWIMAGPLGAFYGQGTATGFSAVWLGEPPFDAREEMRWAAGMYAYLAKAYQYLDPPPPYRVFIRVLPNARGATALANSFMLVASPKAPDSAPAQAPRETMTHEMGHLWVGEIDGPMGVTSWFSEGLNTYYTRLLPMRGGFDSVAAYGRRINADFAEYFTSPARNLSADSIVKIGFNDEGVRHIPYARGSFYFADLDSKIRAASRGKRNLDSLVIGLFRRRARGERFDHEAWIAAVTKEIGGSARTDFERIILRGETIVPASDAFGPCFVRRSAKLTPRAGGPAVDGYEWVRVDTVRDARCRAW